jgi:hypothetical protein
MTPELLIELLDSIAHALMWGDGGVATGTVTTYDPQAPLAPIAPGVGRALYELGQLRGQVLTELESAAKRSRSARSRKPATGTGRGHSNGTARGQDLTPLPPSARGSQLFIPGTPAGVCG